MHPRNVYKIPPDFKQLALDFPEFRKHCIQDLTGKIRINFKDSAALRALTRTLLKRDFGLDVEIPVDRLIPTVPQRLNYILWVEDLLSSNCIDISKVRGIDIGTGASCVFPLLASSKNGWYFLASETDQASYDCATRNVQNNHLQEKVKIVLVSETSSLGTLINDNESQYDFCMCNPPFFCDSFDASWESKARKRTREAPNGANTSSPVETITSGGEVDFVKKVIADSLALKEQVKIYTSMLGKKSSVGLIKEYLADNKVPHFITTEFRQGKTLRWGVAWTFVSNIKLNKICAPKSCKPVKPLSFFVPSTIKCTKYTVLDVLGEVTELLKELNIVFHVCEERETKCKLWIQSSTNTWLHQRRKKRELARQKLQMEISNTSCSDEAELSFTENCALKNEGTTSLVTNGQLGLSDTDKNEHLSTNKGLKRKHSDDAVMTCKVPKSDPQDSCNSSSKSGEGGKIEWLLFADVCISLAGQCILLELTARKEMLSRETLHQIMQLFKNRLV